MTRCNRDGCSERARFQILVGLRAGALRIRFRLRLCPDHAEEMPWLVRLRETRSWDCGLLLEQIEEVSNRTTP